MNLKNNFDARLWDSFFSSAKLSSFVLLFIIIIEIRKKTLGWIPMQLQGVPARFFLQQFLFNISQLAHFARIFLRIMITYFLICVPIRYGYYVAKKPSRFHDNMQVVPKRKMNILPPAHDWKLSFWGGFVERSVVTLGLRAWVPPDVVFFFPFSSLTQLLSREKKRRPSPCLWDGEAGATTLPMQWMANRKVGITIWSDVSISFFSSLC